MVLDPPKIDESRFQARVVPEPESLAIRADFMAHKGSYSQAQVMLEEAVRMDPKLNTAYESMSFLYAAQGHASEASKWASQALVLNPQSFRANYYDAVALMAGGLRDEQTLSKAESRLRTALKINPEFAPAYDRLAFVLSEPSPKQDLNEAYMATLHAEARDPANIHYRVRSVEVLIKQGRTKDAIRVATLALSMAKTPEEQSIAGVALANAKELQTSHSH
jgi:tetratricopeptide (TPR) repeat protein